MKITKISLKDFRAFRGAPIKIDLSDDGKNLLVYGENGSGKSSLFNALNLFFSPLSLSPKFQDHKNIRVTSDDGHVILYIGEDSNSSVAYEWEEAAQPFGNDLIKDTSRTKGFFDYRSLLETHFVHRHSSNVNIFDLIIHTLLANFENPINKTTYSATLQFCESTVKGRRGKWRTEILTKKLSELNAGLTAILSELEAKTNELLTVFEQKINIKLSLMGAGVCEHSLQKDLDNKNVNLQVEYYGTPINSHHHFLNEARLSSIALSMYLAALLLNPPSKLRVLFLDDVLIGLDMSNRLPLLDLLSRYFSDWQIFMTTYDHVWFNIIKNHIINEGNRWEFAELYCGKTDEGDIPIYEKNKDYLKIAQQHINLNDFKAAAIYIRSAYEHILKHFANKHKLHIQYCDNPKEQKADYFWEVIKKAELRSGRIILDSALIARVELFRSTILNQLSHTAPVTFVRSEVDGAHDSITQLKTKLDSIDKKKVKI